MPANTSPISPAVIAPAPWNGITLVNANTTLDGTGTIGSTIGLVCTAGANGRRLNRLRINYTGTCVATVMRFFRNNGLTNATPANNCLIGEVTVPANTLSQVAAAPYLDYAINTVLAANEILYYTIGTAVAAGHKVCCMDAADY